MPANRRADHDRSARVALAAALFSAGAVDRATAQLNATLVLDAPKPCDRLDLTGRGQGVRPAPSTRSPVGRRRAVALAGCTRDRRLGKRLATVGRSRRRAYRAGAPALARTSARDHRGGSGRGPSRRRRPQSRRLGRTPLAIYAPREAPFEIELIDPVGGRTLRTVDFAGRDSLQLVVDLSIVPSRPMSEEVRRSLRTRSCTRGAADRGARRGGGRHRRGTRRMMPTTTTWPRPIGIGCAPVWPMPTAGIASLRAAGSVPRGSGRRTLALADWVRTNPGPSSGHDSGRVDLLGVIR